MRPTAVLNITAITAVLINPQLFWENKNYFIMCALILILSGHAGIFKTTLVPNVPYIMC